MLPGKTIALAAALTVWAGGLATGFAMLEHYAAAAGTVHAPTAAAAEFLRQHQKPGRALLVMAVHPLCPCTDASLAELGDLLARSRGACDALLLQYEPASPEAEWPTDSTRDLGGMSVSVLPDRRGELASALGAETSGHTIFVDAAGAIRFNGGLTVARGHRGRAPAQDAILAALAGRSMTLAQAPVFGCSLLSPCAAGSCP